MTSGNRSDEPIASSIEGKSSPMATTSMETVDLTDPFGLPSVQVSLEGFFELHFWLSDQFHQFQASKTPQEASVTEGETHNVKTRQTMLPASLESRSARQLPKRG